MSKRPARKPKHLVIGFIVFVIIVIISIIGFALLKPSKQQSWDNFKTSFNSFNPLSVKSTYETTSTSNCFPNDIPSSIAGCFFDGYIIYNLDNKDYSTQVKQSIEYLKNKGYAFSADQFEETYNAEVDRADFNNDPVVSIDMVKKDGTQMEFKLNSKKQVGLRVGIDEKAIAQIPDETPIYFFHISQQYK